MTAATLAVSALLATACGTTVPLAQERASATGSAGSTGSASAGGAANGITEQAPPAAGSTDAAFAPSSDGSTTAAGSVPGAAAAGTGRTSTGAGSAAAAGGPARSVPGMTASTVKIGVYTVAGYSKAASAAGFNAALGDQAAMTKEIVGYINANGGFAGRQGLPVIHDANLAAPSADAEYQAACAAWTQDDRVYAVVSPIGTGSNTLYDCLSKAGVPTVGAGESQDASFFQRFPDWFYQPTDMNLRRILSNNVDALAGVGFFGSKPKIGVIMADTPTERAAVDRGLKPALARHGLKLAKSFAVVQDSSAQSAYSGAVLQFKAAGITHVLFSYLGSAVLFMTNAENQQYRPRYGLHSRNSPAALLEGNAPARQQEGAMGIGWQPMNDVNQANDPGILGPRQQLCLKLIRKAGQDTTVRATALIGLWLCDGLFFLRDALQKAPSFSAAGLRTGVESLRDFDAASTFRSGFAPGRLHDGASLYRMFAFNSECRCYRYISPGKTAF